MTGELDLFQSAIAIKLDREMNLVTARRIIAMDFYRRVCQLAEVSRPAGMIQDHFLIKFLELSEFGDSFEEVRSLLKDLDHQVDLFARIIKIKAGPG